TAQLVASPSHASSFTLNTDGTFTYTPASGFHGSDSFTYQAVDSLGGVSNTATVSITVNATPSITINDVSHLEGQSGTTTFIFTVTLSNVSSQTVTVAYATANGTATAGSDYTATSGTLSFSPGATSRQITVNVTGDTTFEDNETFYVNLSNATHATIGDSQ